MNLKAVGLLLSVAFVFGVFIGATVFPIVQTRIVDSVVFGAYFSPNHGCTEQVVSWVDNANSSIHILIYSFTSDRIADALVRAHNRNTQISIVFELDNIAQAGSEYQRLIDAGINVRDDANSGLMHDKVMIVDGKVVLTGSFNWTSSAENTNNENLIIITSTNIASVYENEFQKIWDSAQ